MSAPQSSRQSSKGDILLPGEHRKGAQSVAAHQPRQPSLAAISDRLQPRDYAIALLLDEHSVLTTVQLASLLFGSVITCQHRLQLLRRLGFVDRFLRNQPGRPHPACWVPGLLSARYAALSRLEPPPTARVLRERQDRIYASPKLDHQLGVNGFFVDLLVHARHDEQGRLRRWWSEARSAAAFGRRIHPDGHGVWRDGPAEVGFFLEYDTGTEPLGRLAAKLDAYRRLHADGGPSYPVLFYLPGRTREQNLHRTLAERVPSALAVATAAADGVNGAGPAGPVWRLAGNGRRRLRLSELPSAHGQPGPLHPGPPTPEQDPLRVLLPGGTQQPTPATQQRPTARR